MVEKTLANGHYVLGPNVAALEQEVAAYTTAKFGIGVNSGSDALTLALRALDIGPGDEVITTPFTYIAPAESIYQVGAKIVFADVHPRTFNIDPAEVAKKITAQTKAIIPVHLFGQAAPLDELFALAKPRGIHLVEDCAQAIGATYRGKPVGSHGALGCFSFYPTGKIKICALNAGYCVRYFDFALYPEHSPVRIGQLSPGPRPVYLRDIAP